MISDSLNVFAKRVLVYKHLQYHVWKSRELKLAENRFSAKFSSGIYRIIQNSGNKNFKKYTNIFLAW